MSDVSAIGNTAVEPLQQAAPVEVMPREGVETPAAIAAGEADRVELSEQARLIEQLRDMPDVRQDRIEAIRAALVDGTYLTDEKLQVAVDRVIDEISG